MFTFLRIAWRNLGRNRKRTALALCAIALAQFCVLAIDGFMAGYGDSIRNLLTGPMLGHFQVHAKDYRDDRSMDLAIGNAAAHVKELEGTPDVTNVMPRIYGPALAAKTQEGFMAVVIGLDPAAEHRPGGIMAHGSMSVAQGKEALGDDGDDRRAPALIGAALADRQKLSVGDELAVIGQTADGMVASDLIVIRGIVRSNLDLVSRMGIVIALDRAQEIFGMEDQIHEITVRGEDPTRATELAQSVGKLAGFADLEVMAWRELAPEMVDMIEMQDYSTLFILVLVFLAAAAGVANTMLMSTFERTKEMGMLLALGTGPRQVVFMLIAETIMLGILGIAVGSLLGTAFNLALGVDGFDMAVIAGEDLNQLSWGGMNFDFRIFPRVRIAAILQGFAAMGVTCLLASLWPTSYVSRLEPTEAMRR